MNKLFNLLLFAVPMGLGLLGMDDSGTAIDCASATTHMEKVVCGTNDFFDSISSSSGLSSALRAWTR